MIHPKVMAALEEIDAAVMNSDTFDGCPDVLRFYVERWKRWTDAQATQAPGVAKEPT